MTTPVFGSPEWLAARFDRFARDDIFAGHQPTPEEPLLVLLGGQPAAGKTTAQNRILAEHADLVPITGDDLREHHPDYVRLMADDPLAMPNATAPVSGGLVRLGLEHALAHRYSVLLEGIFRDATMVTATAIRFAQAGYRVEAVAVATAAAISRLSAEQRALAAAFPRIGRWTPPSAHETALAGSPGVVAALERLACVTRIRVFSRQRLLYDNTRNDSGDWRRPATAAETLRAEQTRTLAPADAVEWLSRYERVFTLAAERPGYLGHITAPAYRLLQSDATSMISVARTASASAAAVFEREQADRAAPPRPRCARTQRRVAVAASELPSTSRPGHSRAGRRGVSLQAKRQLRAARCRVMARRAGLPHAAVGAR